VCVICLLIRQPLYCGQVCLIGEHLDVTSEGIAWLAAFCAGKSLGAGRIRDASRVSGNESAAGSRMAPRHPGRSAVPMACEAILRLARIDSTNRPACPSQLQRRAQSSETALMAVISSTPREGNYAAARRVRGLHLSPRSAVIESDKDK
jgi:hypothetical protein